MMHNEPINMTQLNELISLLDQGMGDLCTHYLTDSQRDMDNIQLAYAQLDEPLAITSVQSLRGASGNIGATVLEDLCRQLQLECKSGRLASSDVIIQSIREELHRVRLFLSAQFH